MGIAGVLAIFSGITRNKSDASNNLARLCGIVSVVLLFSSGILIAATLHTYVAVKYPTGYSFSLMVFSQFLSFLAAMLVAHWMVSILVRACRTSQWDSLRFLGQFVHRVQLNTLMNNTRTNVSCEPVHMDNRRVCLSLSFVVVFFCRFLLLLLLRTASSWRVRSFLAILSNSAEMHVYSLLCVARVRLLFSTLSFQ
jgi:hypothetical protein